MIMGMEVKTPVPHFIRLGDADGDGVVRSR